MSIYMRSGLTEKNVPSTGLSIFKDVCTDDKAVGGSLKCLRITLIWPTREIKTLAQRS